MRRQCKKTGTILADCSAGNIPGNAQVLMTAVSSLALTIPKAGIPVVAPGVTPSVIDFLALLAPVSPSPDDTRQEDAAPGKDLPDADSDDPAAAFAWIAPALPLLPDTPPAPAETMPVAVSMPGTRTPPSAITAGAPALPAEPTTVSAETGARTTPPVAIQDAPRPDAPVERPAPVAAPTQRAASDSPAAPVVATHDPSQPVRATISIDRPPREQAASPAAPVTRTPAPHTPTEPQVARIAPAAQVFAAAIRRVVVEDRPATPQPMLAAPPVGTDHALHAVAAAASPQQPALDLKQDDWPHRMIQRIEALRDTANANDASIRLIPDALGKIDVSLKREGDSVSVHLDAHQPETRQILADAQPRLAELAETRGIRLSATTGGATDTAGHMPQHQHRAHQPAAPRAPTAAADDTETLAADDGRLA